MVQYTIFCGQALVKLHETDEYRMFVWDNSALNCRCITQCMIAIDPYLREWGCTARA